jgi:hypothetical protein
MAQECAAIYSGKEEPILKKDAPYFYTILYRCTIRYVTSNITAVLIKITSRKKLFFLGHLALNLSSSYTGSETILPATYCGPIKFTPHPVPRAKG